ncbi:hypothetical protein B0T14DRAFT_125490 [Immersiella caudata]|uniref:Uncharacterized protein n=1 Tax=Immersiella caudata TaxID=314043 RepID=A0AA39X491_9PEZI|nr:hypothetical protein B0T14DRAFT_125490 [Immersiella caudata]
MQHLSLARRVRGHFLCSEAPFPLLTVPNPEGRINAIGYPEGVILACSDTGALFLYDHSKQLSCPASAWNLWDEQRDGLVSASRCTLTFPMSDTED